MTRNTKSSVAAAAANANANANNTVLTNTPVVQSVKVTVEPAVVDKKSRGGNNKQKSSAATAAPVVVTTPVAPAATATAAATTSNKEEKKSSRKRNAAAAELTTDAAVAPVAPVAAAAATTHVAPVEVPVVAPHGIPDDTPIGMVGEGKTTGAGGVAKTAVVLPSTAELFEQLRTIREDKVKEEKTHLQNLHVLSVKEKTVLRELERSHLRDLKAAAKTSSRKKATRSATTADGSKRVSHFLKPQLISEKMSAFFGKPAGTQMSPVEVNQEMQKYILANQLKDPKSGQKIIPDAKMRAFFEMAEGETCTYFSMQKYLKHHFIRTPATTAATTPAL